MKFLLAAFDRYFKKLLCDILLNLYYSYLSIIYYIFPSSFFLRNYDSMNIVYNKSLISKLTEWWNDWLL